ncbi:MAG TPA: PIN-like domain-containing protein [Oculatellaceae cyanobacterium]
MKKLFSAFYEQPKLNDKTWESALVSIDTNVLLHSYRWGRVTQDVFVDALKALSGRLWLTFHAALEYHRHRPEYLLPSRNPSTLVTGASTVKKIKDSWSESKKSATQSLQEPIDALSQAVDAIYKHIEATGLGDKGYEKRADEHSEKLAKAFKGRCLSKLGADELQELFSSEPLRSAQGIPPGLTDQSKSSNRLGDLIIWTELKRLAKEKKLPLIFVTDETKLDWWSLNKRNRWTNPELFSEFRDLTGQDLFVISADQFVDETASVFKLSGDISAAVLDMKSSNPTLIEFNGGELSNKSCFVDFELPDVIAVPVERDQWSTYRSTSFLSDPAHGKKGYGHSGTSSQPAPGAVRYLAQLRGTELVGLIVDLF